MTNDPTHLAEIQAIERLGWTTQQVYIEAMSYGDVGTCDDVREHLRTGNHLPPHRRAFIAAALWDAELPPTDRENEPVDAGSASSARPAAVVDSIRDHGVAAFDTTAAPTRSVL